LIPAEIAAEAPAALASAPVATPLASSAEGIAAGAPDVQAKSGSDQPWAGLANIATSAPTTAATSSAAPAKQGGAQAPAHQIAPVLVQLGHNAGGGQVTLQLNPLELGKVQIQIDRGADGTAAVHVSAERPDTLQLLVADQAQLHQALNAAGVPSDGRTLSLSLSTPDQGGSGQASGDAGQGGANSQTGGQSGGQQNRASYGLGAGLDSATDNGGTASWLRAGVDITA
jgi:flagellar hook-length control protein FliK